MKTRFSIHTLPILRSVVSLVLLTAKYCGRCDNDHKSSKEIADIVKSMSFSERKKYFSHPIRSNKDYLKYIRRNMPLRYPMVYIGRILNVYFPKFYYKINGIR